MAYYMPLADLYPCGARNEAIPMQDHELRSEILSDGGKYYLQTDHVPSRSAVVTTMFSEGDLLSRQSESVDPNLPPEQLRIAVAGIHDEAKTRITSLLDVRGKIKKLADARAHLKLGDALNRQKLHREAMAEVIRAVKLGLEESRAYGILGNCLIAVGDFDKALKSFRKALEISPGYPDHHNDQGRAYLKLERCRDAADAFESAIKANRYYLDAFVNMAIALSLNIILKQDYDLSRDVKAKLGKLLEMCLQLKPSLETDGFRAARAAVDTESYDVVYEKLVAIRDEGERVVNHDLSLELYLILKFRGGDLTEEDLDACVTRVLREIESNPNYADLHNDLGILYAAKCKVFIDKANTAFKHAVEINKNYHRASKNLKLAINDKQGIDFLLRALLD